MDAFVFSGGANLGSVQVGMVQGLLESGVAPDLVVGTSIGAANAAYIAADPSVERARELGKVWGRLRSADVFPLNPLRALRSLARTGAVFSPDPLRRLLGRELGFERIEDATVPLRIVSTRFADGEEVVFEQGPVMDAILASTALPGIFPPHGIAGRLYLDGGLSDQVPLQPAVEAGANRVYVLSVGFPCPPSADHRSARSVLLHSIGILLSQRIRVHSTDLFAQPNLEIVQLPPVCTEVGLRDFSKSSALIDQAREQTLRFLAGQACPTCRHEHDDATRGGIHEGTAVPEVRSQSLAPERVA
jgi:NTE family protein